MDGFLYDSHPMRMLVSTVAALSTHYPDSRDVFGSEVRQLQIKRLIAKMPTLAAFAYRHSLGQPYVYPELPIKECAVRAMQFARSRCQMTTLA